MNALVRCSFRKNGISFHDSLVRRTLAPSRRLIKFDRRQAPLPLWLSEALRVARVAKGEPAGARFATWLNCTFPRHHIADDNLFVNWNSSNKWANMPAFSRLGILLRLRRQHEPSSTPPVRPSLGGPKQAGTVGEDANEKVLLASRKGPRSAESTRNSCPAATRFWVSYVHVFICDVSSNLYTCAIRGGLNLRR